MFLVFYVFFFFFNDTAPTAIYTLSLHDALPISPALAGLRRDGVAVVPNGVDIAAALGLSTAGVRLAERLHLYRADPLLVLPARLTRRKRIEAAIAATAALRGRGHPA